MADVPVWPLDQVKPVNVPIVETVTGPLQRFKVFGAEINGIVTILVKDTVHVVDVAVPQFVVTVTL